MSIIAPQNSKTFHSCMNCINVYGCIYENMKQDNNHQSGWFFQ